MSKRKQPAQPVTVTPFQTLREYHEAEYARVLADNPKARARHLLFVWSGERNLAWRMEDYLTFTGNAEADAQRALNEYWAAQP